MKRSPAEPLITIRLWPRHHRKAAELEELIAALRDIPGSCDEVWFCTPWGYPTLDYQRADAELMTAAMQRVRAMGIRPGLQIANTLGHGMSALWPRDAAKWPTMVDATGVTDESTPCPRAPEFLRYLDETGRIYAATGPSSVWIDDDLRMNHHGRITWGCFCAACVAAFSKQRGKSFTRASLVEELHAPTNGELRLEWTRFNGESLALLARAVGRAFHEVSPETRLGFQQLRHDLMMYSGPDWHPIYEELAQASGAPTGARLGDGVYTDHAPRQLLNKAFVISRQVDRLHLSVAQVCPEVENFTHNFYGKSAHGTAVESSLYLAVGCNCLSYAAICSDHEPISFHRKILSKLSAYRPFWETYLQANEGTRPAGVEIVLGRNHVTREVAAEEPKFSWSQANLEPLYQLATLGIPFCTGPSVTEAALLSVETVAGLSDVELKALLSRGAMMDGPTAMRLQERGLEEYLGARVEKLEAANVFERVSAHPLNGAHAGRPWLTFQETVYRLVTTGNSEIALGEYEEPGGRIAGTATALVENRFGGRVAIFGYVTGWSVEISAARRNQYAAAADWISRSRMPVVNHTDAQVVLVPRVDADGKLASVFVLNASIERTEALRLEVRRPRGEKGRWIVPEMEPVEVVMETGMFCEVPGVAAWSCGCLVIGTGSG